ncbi:MAG: zinc-binding dehydrogenase [Melioribacteraceae bacterium]|nr:zinc-binding dehydrogenase [Melioribacteraceae bacterium]
MKDGVMNTTGLRLYGKNDLRVESFELPEIGEDEILAEVETNSICMSSYKAVVQGSAHKRVPENIAESPVLIGHELCGTIIKVGKKYQNKFKEGMKYTIQPAINYPGKEPEAPGYSFQYIGGNATRIIIPKEVLEMDCLIPCYGDTFYKVSLAEPVACLVAAFKEQFHYDRNQYVHKMGIEEDGNLAILGGCGPMGLAAVDVLLNSERKPKLIVVTDVDQNRIERARKLFPTKKSKVKGVEVLFINTTKYSNQEILKETDGKGFDDVFVFVPIKSLVQQAGELMAIGGCLNFFAGPSDKNFTSEINFYNVHYNRHHIIGSAGSNSDDLREAVKLIDENIFDPAIMISHIGGLNCTAETVKNLPKIPGGKKLIYTQYSLPLTALDDFESVGKTNSLFADLAKIIEKTNGVWSKEAEKHLMANAEKINGNKFYK